MCRSKPFRFSARAGLVGVLLALAVGCSQSPVGPATDAPVLLTRLSRAGGALSAAEVNLYVEQLVPTQSGGRLELLDVTLDIPPGAVANDTVFSIFIPDDELFYNEFGTSGLVFDVPVSVTMSYRNADLTGITETSIRIAWYNADIAWEPVDGTIDLVNKTVTAQLSHFSAYGLISDARPGGQ